MKITMANSFRAKPSQDADAIFTRLRAKANRQAGIRRAVRLWFIYAAIVVSLSAVAGAYIEITTAAR